MGFYFLLKSQKVDNVLVRDCTFKSFKILIPFLRTLLNVEESISLTVCNC